MTVVKGVALVTGASQGIGRAIALRLAEDGYDVAINDIPRGKENLAILRDEIQAKGRKVWSIIGDVSIEDDVKGMISGAVENLGSLDVMIANAAILITKPIVETTVEDWDKIFSVNARGTFLCYKYAGQQMIKQGRGGRIIGATSTLGHQAQQMSGAYASTKFAIRGLTQATAKELGPHGITVNVYAPGAINTTMLSAPGIPRENTKLIQEAEGKKTVLGYIGEPEDIASIVSYLASKEAHFITDIGEWRPVLPVTPALSGVVVTDEMLYGSKMCQVLVCKVKLFFFVGQPINSDLRFCMERNTSEKGISGTMLY